MSKKRTISPHEYQAMQDSTNNKAPQTSGALGKNWDGMVQKADGTVGKWGNDIPVKKEASDRLYPKGELKPEDKAYLKSLKDKDVDAVLSRAIKKPGQVAQYGTSDSDYIKGVLNRRKPAIDHRVYKQK